MSVNHAPYKTQCIALLLINLIMFPTYSTAATYCSAVYNGRKWCWTEPTGASSRLSGTIHDTGYMAIRFFYYDYGAGPYYVNSSQFPNTVGLILGGAQNGNLCDCSAGGLEDAIAIMQMSEHEIVPTDGWAYLGFRSGCSNGQSVGLGPVFQILDLERDHVFEVLSPNLIASTDAVDDSGHLAGQAGWNPNGTCKCSLADATYHTVAIKSGLASLCSDLNGINNTDSSDAVGITPCIKRGASCTRQQ